MNKTKIVLSSIIALILVFPAFGFQLYMPGDGPVEGILDLYARAGRVFPDASFPLSKADLDRYAARLLDGAKEAGDDGGSLDGPTITPELQAEIREYRDELNFQVGREHYGSDLFFQTVGFFHGDTWVEGPDTQKAGDTIEGAGEYSGPDTVGAGDFSRYPNDFHTRFVEFPDMAALALWAGVEGQSGLHISAGIKRRYFRDESPWTNMFNYDEKEKVMIENYLIRTGYLAWKTDHFEARFGRTPVHYGDAEFSTFLPNKKLPWMDTFTYRYNLGPLTMTSYFGTLENRISKDEEALFGVDDHGAGGTDTYTILYDDMAVGFNDSGELVTGSAGFDPDDPESAAGKELAFAETIILTSMHRFVLGWEKLRLGATAHVVVARERNALLIGDVFPVFSWHNGFIGHHNMHLVFDAGYTPLPRVALYGQAAWDDINATDLMGIPDASRIPSIGAYLLGVSWRPEIEWSQKSGTAGAAGRPKLHVKAELGKTHYLWGSYYSYHEEKGGYFERAIYRYRAQKGVMWMPLTSPYGPGSVWTEGQADLQFSGGLKLSIGGVYVNSNSAADLLALPYGRNDELEDAPRTRSYSVWTKAEYRLGLTDWALKGRLSDMSVSLRPVFYSYDGHMWPELEFGVNIATSYMGVWN